MRPCIKEGYAAPGRPASKYFDQNRRLLPSFYDPHRKFALRANRYKSAAGALKTNCLGMNQIFGSNAEVKPFGHIRGRRIAGPGNFGTKAQQVPIEHEWEIDSQQRKLTNCGFTHKAQ